MKRFAATLFVLVVSVFIYAAPLSKDPDYDRKWQWQHSQVGFFCYGGVYPIGLILPHEHKSYGYHFGIGYRLLGLEYSHTRFLGAPDMMIDLLFKQKEYDPAVFGNAWWSGEKQHLGITYYDVGHDNGPINGNLYLLYEQETRTYRELRSIVKTEKDGTVIDSFARFHPRQKGYNLWYGFTGEWHWKVFYFRIGFGLGIGFRQFSTGGDYARDVYYFENPLLEYRRPSRVSGLFRLDVSSGLIFRSKRNK